MNGWHDRRILDLFGIDLPILQAPMAGVSTPEMAIAVSEAGRLCVIVYRFAARRSEASPLY
jgi:nitronate monooxygenase